MAEGIPAKSNEFYLEKFFTMKINCYEPSPDEQENLERRIAFALWKEAQASQNGHSQT